LDATGVGISRSGSKTFQPNIVLINTDDMRYEQTRFMPFLEQLANDATVFERSYVPTSVSGPSRASLMSGLFAASQGVLRLNLV
jgi:N-acetylglucosamine-6-sulfatase